MLSQKTILIIESNAYVALDLATGVENRGGRVAGPVGTADEALAYLAANRVDGALLDGDMNGASAIAASLCHGVIPFVLQSGSTFSPALRRLCDPRAVLARPVDSAMVLSLLAIQIEKADHGVVTMIVPNQPTA